MESPGGLGGKQDGGWEGEDVGGSQNLCGVQDMGLHASRLESTVYVQHAEIAWVSFGDGMWTTESIMFGVRIWGPSHHLRDQDMGDYLHAAWSGAMGPSTRVWE